MGVVNFPGLLRRVRGAVHYAGFIVGRLAVMSGDHPDDENKLVIDQHQSTGAFGVHQARVRLAGDETVYRMILAPADAPVMVNGVPADSYFLEPLERGR